MNQKNLNIILGLVVLVLIGVLVYFAFGRKPAQNVVVNNPASTPVQTGSVYENQFMKLTVADGWTAVQANKIVSKISQPNPAAVNVTKGNYILFINVQASQASGVEGGRFAEIAQGAPSVDAVVVEQPSPPCGGSATVPVLLEHPRVDWYVSSQDKTQFCNVPNNSKTAWYFSYITDKAGDYFNYYPKPNTDFVGYVITLAYNSKNINDFPEKGSSSLNSTLDEMTGMVKTLEIK